MEKVDIYIDMDGVIADFYGYVEQKYGSSYSEIIDQPKFWETEHDGIFNNLVPLPDAKQLIDGLLKLQQLFPINLHILTALPRTGDKDLFSNDKKEWIGKYFGYVPELLENFNTGPHAVDKQNHCDEHNVLIDDNPRNIVQWIHKGGVGILHCTGNHVNSIKAIEEHLRHLGFEL